MGIGVVVTAHRLIPVAQHGPAALDVQGHPGAVKADALQIGPGLLHHLRHQGREGGMKMQLPDAVEITGPGATFAGVARGLPPQRQQKLQMGSQVQRIELKLHRGNGRRENLMKPNRQMLNAN